MSTITPGGAYERTSDRLLDEEAGREMATAGYLDEHPEHEDHPDLDILVDARTDDLLAEQFAELDAEQPWWVREP